MALFKKTNTKIFSKPSQKVTPDTVYWKELGVPVLLKEFGAIDYIDFYPLEPHYFAVTCSVRVQVYNPITKLVHKTLSRFKEGAYGGSFRSDGQLLCAGSEECLVKLFDVHSKSMLREFKGHTAPVHRCYFTSDGTHLASFSDDKTACLWDIPTETRVNQFFGHEDYVRAGAISPVSPTTFVSGCYDKKIRMFDSRTNTDAVVTVDHGHPVESVLFLPSGGIFISAGGNELRVWDALAGGRILARVSHHHKTITCLALASNNTRLLSGSLDRHVKIYDVSTYKVVHNLDYPNAILSLGVSNNDETVVAGTVDGIISVKRREAFSGQLNSSQRRDVALMKTSYKYTSDKFVPPSSVDAVVVMDKKQTVGKSDTHLRKFQYSKALDSVLIPYVVNKNPHATVALMQELIRRKGLYRAITNREGQQLLPLLRFLIRNIGDYRFTRVLIDVTNTLLDVYENELEDMSLTVLGQFKRLQERLKEEEELTKDLAALGGAMNMLLAASTTSDKQVSTHMEPLVPSQRAQENFVLSV